MRSPATCMQQKRNVTFVFVDCATCELSELSPHLWWVEMKPQLTPRLSRRGVGDKQAAMKPEARQLKGSQIACEQADDSQEGLQSLIKANAA